MHGDATQEYNDDFEAENEEASLQVSLETSAALASCQQQEVFLQSSTQHVSSLQLNGTKSHQHQEMKQQTQQEQQQQQHARQTFKQHQNQHVRQQQQQLPHHYDQEQLVQSWLVGTSPRPPNSSSCAAQLLLQRPLSAALTTSQRMLHHHHQSPSDCLAPTANKPASIAAASSTIPR